MAAPGGMVRPRTGEDDDNEDDHDDDSDNEDGEVQEDPRASNRPKHKRGRKSKKKKKKKNKKKKRTSDDGDDATVTDDEGDLPRNDIPPNYILQNNESLSLSVDDIDEDLEVQVHDEEEVVVPARDTVELNADIAIPPSLIAKNEFSIDHEVTEASVRRILGDTANRMTQQQVQEYVQKIADLKIQAAAFMKLKVERIIYDLARQDANIKDPSILGLQKLWASLDVKQRKGSEGVMKTFWRITQPGATRDFPKKWDRKLEKTFMKRYNWKYKKDGTDLDDAKGCISKMAGRALRNVRKKLWNRGKRKKGHGAILSANQTGIRGTGKKKQPKNRRKGLEFSDKYCRPSISCITGEEAPASLLDPKSSSEECDSSSDDSSSSSSGKRPPKKGRKGSSSNGKRVRKKVRTTTILTSCCVFFLFGNPPIYSFSVFYCRVCTDIGKF
jgi:hypothetical protein